MFKIATPKNWIKIMSEIPSTAAQEDVTLPGGILGNHPELHLAGTILRLLREKGLAYPIQTADDFFAGIAKLGNSGFGREAIDRAKVFSASEEFLPLTSEAEFLQYAILTYQRLRHERHTMQTAGSGQGNIEGIVGAGSGLTICPRGVYSMVYSAPTYGVIWLRTVDLPAININYRVYSTGFPWYASNNARITTQNSAIPVIPSLLGTNVWVRPPVDVTVFSG
jgi:hypothetical protein